MHPIFKGIHILAGTIAILAGFLSIIPRKGSPIHIALGTCYFYSMLIMAGMASFLAAFSTSEPINVLVGIFTMYLVLTGKFAAANHLGKITRKETATSILGFLLFIGFITLLILAIQNGKPLMDGVYIEAYYFFVLLSSIAVTLDVKVLVNRGVFGKQRVARHLWRMILALFIATTSLVYGQPQVFPDVIRSSGILNIPVLIIVLSLIFWLIKVYVTKRFSRAVK